jgi:Tol biopolymer transport system component
MKRMKGLPSIFWLGDVVLAAVVSLLLFLFALVGVRVTSISPNPGDRQAAITVPLRITFSHEMDAESVEAHLRLEPETPGRLVVEGRVVTFWPHPSWAPGQAYTLTLQSGMAAVSGRALAEERTGSFRTRSPQLLYLDRPDSSLSPDAARQLFVAPAGAPPTSSGGASAEALGRQLTAHAEGVWDYAVHPQGEAIVYSVLREDGGSDLWWMDRDGERQRLLLSCPDMACLHPAWSPDGRLLAYEQRGIWAGAPNLDAQASRLWLLDPESKKTRPLFDYDVPLHSPLWAPQGERLAYLSPLAAGVEVFDLPTEELLQFPNEWGGTPAWSPDGQDLAISELMLAGEAFVVRLLRIDVEAGEVLQLSGEEEMVQDVSPAWSPGGGWIAFGRQFLDGERWTPGRQIWLTRPDGSEAYPLREEPMADHFGFAWRPDGGALAYVRNDLSEGAQPVPQVEVWVMDLVRREPFLVAQGGVLPGWLP